MHGKTRSCANRKASAILIEGTSQQRGVCMWLVSLVFIFVGGGSCKFGACHDGRCLLIAAACCACLVLCGT